MNEFCYGGSSIDVNTYDQIRLKLTAGTSYDANMRCQLRLTTTWDSQLMVYFKSMDISYSSGCQTDYLQLYDGSTRSFPLIPGKTLHVISYFFSGKQLCHLFCLSFQRRLTVTKDNVLPLEEIL